MPKPKDFTSIYGVVGRAIELIGAEAVADVIGKSAPWVYRLADSDNETAELQYIKDAIAIDTACLAAGHPAPFLAHYQRCIGLPDADSHRLDDRIYALGEIFGQVMAQHKSARCPDGPAGSAYSFSEERGLKNAVHLVRETCDQIENASDDKGILPHKKGGSL